MLAGNFPPKLTPQNQLPRSQCTTSFTVSLFCLRCVQLGSYLDNTAAKSAKGIKYEFPPNKQPNTLQLQHLASAGYRCQAMPTPLKPSGCGPDVKRSISRKLQMLLFLRPPQGKLRFCLKYFLNLDCFATPSMHVKLWDRLQTATENVIQLESRLFSKTTLRTDNSPVGFVLLGLHLIRLKNE